jgi:hypothetical protein
VWLGSSGILSTLNVRVFDPGIMYPQETDGNPGDDDTSIEVCSMLVAHRR